MGERKYSPQNGQKKGIPYGGLPSGLKKSRIR
jgi:hypothetical protein